MLRGDAAQYLEDIVNELRIKVMNIERNFSKFQGGDVQTVSRDNVGQLRCELYFEGKPGPKTVKAIEEINRKNIHASIRHGERDTEIRALQNQYVINIIVSFNFEE